MKLPGKLNAALETWLMDQGQGREAAKATSALSEAYRTGRSSSHVDPVAYLTARLPATYAACTEVFARVVEVTPNFSPNSLLDVGAGPGTATWAALGQWPRLAVIAQVEPDARFAAIAKELNAASGRPALEDASLQQASAQHARLTPHDLVIASYVLAELPQDQGAELALKLWHVTSQMLVLIEPGTPQGFARIRAARAALLQQGAHVVAPCTHGSTCPKTEGDWCHFKVRLSRSRAHMQAKGAVVPFEDEAFSYLAVSRMPVASAGARIIGPIRLNKVAVTLSVCADGALHNLAIASRDKPSYKQARKLVWGDSYSAHNSGKT